MKSFFRKGTHRRRQIAAGLVRPGQHYAETDAHSWRPNWIDKNAPS